MIGCSNLLRSCKALHLLSAAVYQELRNRMLVTYMCDNTYAEACLSVTKFSRRSRK